MSCVPEQQQKDGLSPRLTGIWVTGVSTILGEPGSLSLLLFFCTIPFSPYFPQLFILHFHHSLFVFLSKAFIFFLCFSAKSPVSSFLHPLPLHLQPFPSPPLLISPPLISHAHRPFSSCFTSTFDPPFLLNHHSSSLILKQFPPPSSSSSHTPLHPLFCFLPRMRIIYFRGEKKKLEVQAMVVYLDTYSKYVAVQY